MSHSSRIRFEQVPPDSIDWESLETFADRTVFQSREWLGFLEETQGGEAVVLRIRREDRPEGFFTGMLVRKAGLRLLGSPLPGWTTAYMGFNLDTESTEEDRIELLQELIEFAFKELGCAHIEVMDRKITPGGAERAGLDHRLFTGFELDLSRSGEELFSDMTGPCRRCIRKAEKTGVSVEPAGEDDTFAGQYYSQLEEVFGRQGLRPTYEVSRVEALIRKLPASKLLLLRAVAPDGECIASGIFPGNRSLAYFWGGASRSKQQHLRPNEAIQWEAWMYWKGQGVPLFDFGGGGSYKKKFGGRPIAVPWIRKSKYRALPLLRNLYRKTVQARQRLRSHSGGAVHA